MPLTDPELDLLREVLEEDPADDVYVDVARELLRRGLPADAAQVIDAGMASNPDVDGALGVHAEASFALGRPRAAVTALERLRPDPFIEPQLARLLVLALDASGLGERAEAAASRYLEAHPGDPLVSDVLKRLSAPPPDARLRGRDPLVNVERAEEYVTRGRPDRAVRVYRRILRHHPGEVGVEVRLKELASKGFEPIPDDLSEEITDPGQPPPDLTMPEPGVASEAVVDGPTGDEESTDVVAKPSRKKKTIVSAEEPTDVGAPERTSRPGRGGGKPRSLLGR